jgi:hypothetical protein
MAAKRRKQDDVKVELAEDDDVKVEYSQVLANTLRVSRPHSVSQGPAQTLSAVPLSMRLAAAAGKESKKKAQLQRKTSIADLFSGSAAKQQQQQPGDAKELELAGTLRENLETTLAVTAVSSESQQQQQQQQQHESLEPVDSLGEKSVVPASPTATTSTPLAKHWDIHAGSDCDVDLYNLAPTDPFQSAEMLAQFDDKTADDIVANEVNILIASSISANVGAKEELSGAKDGSFSFVLDGLESDTGELVVEICEVESEADIYRAGVECDKMNAGYIGSQSKECARA